MRRPRASPLGNLTTVGHLAKVSPDLSPHFQTLKTVFDMTQPTGVRLRETILLPLEKPLGVFLWT